MEEVPVTDRTPRHHVLQVVSATHMQLLMCIHQCVLQIDHATTVAAEFRRVLNQLIKIRFTTRLVRGSAMAISSAACLP